MFIDWSKKHWSSFPSCSGQVWMSSWWRIKHNFPHKRPPQNVWPSKNILSPRNLKNFLSVRTGHPKVTKYQRDNFPHKRPPQNVWPSKIFLSPRKCYTEWSRYYFPHKRPPQNVWPCIRANISPEQAEEGVTLLSCQLACLAEASKNILYHQKCLHLDSNFRWIKKIS